MNKQIEEIRKLLNECCDRYDENGNHLGNRCYECEYQCDTNHICCSYNEKEAIALYNADYRKTSDVAREILGRLSMLIKTAESQEFFKGKISWVVESDELLDFIKNINEEFSEVKNE